jgi:adenosylcobyric acid synthase
VAVIALPHISNFDDFDPLEREAGVGLRYVRTLGELGTPDLVVLPGTKTTMADLDALRQGGLADAVVSLAHGGTAVVGICGGFQMLGRRILDPERVESDRAEATGLGLLPVVTTFDDRKETRQVLGTVEADYGMLAGSGGAKLAGYEIHMGRSEGGSEPFVLDGGDSPRADGAMSDDGWVLGTYVHGVFLNDGLRRGVLRRIAERKGVSLPDDGVGFDQGAEYDKLAAHFRESIDMDAVYRGMGLSPAERRPV